MMTGKKSRSKNTKNTKEEQNSSHVPPLQSTHRSGEMVAQGVQAFSIQSSLEDTWCPGLRTWKSG